MPKLAKTYTKAIDRKVYKLQWWVENLDFVGGHWQVTKIYIALKGPGTKMMTISFVRDLATGKILDRNGAEANELIRKGLYRTDWDWHYEQRPVPVSNHLLWHHIFEDMTKAEELMAHWQAGEIDYLIMESLL